MNFRNLLSLTLLVGAAATCLAFEPDNYKHIGLFPTNLATHGISFSYHTNVSAVKIQLPAEFDGAPFKEALLFFAKGSDQYLQIPVQPVQSESKLTVAFWMDGRSLHESELRVTFQRPMTAAGTQLHLYFKHFVRAEGTPHNPTVQRTEASRSAEQTNRTSEAAGSRR
jgi:hypothetical protein